MRGFGLPFAFLLGALAPACSSGSSGCPPMEMDPEDPVAYCGECRGIMGQEPNEEDGCVDYASASEVVVCVPAEEPTDAVDPCYRDPDSGRVFVMNVDSDAIAGSSRLEACPDEVAATLGTEPCPHR